MEKSVSPQAIQTAEKLGTIAFRSSSGLQPAESDAEKKVASAPGPLVGSADQNFCAMVDPRLPVGGYVLAGGRSSRMGNDKALLQLAGKPLIQHAVAKLRSVCADVHILSSTSALAPYAPLVADIHPNCGPIGGMESALTHSAYDWNLFLAVDMPFVPTACIASWVRDWIQKADDGAKIRMFTSQGRPQPGFSLLHKDVLPFLSEAINEGNLKLMRAFEEAGRELAQRRGYPPKTGLAIQADTNGPDAGDLPTVQQAVQHLWFANLNTPADFIEAETHADALDI